MISEICPVCDGTAWHQPPEKKLWVCSTCEPGPVAIEPLAKPVPPLSPTALPHSVAPPPHPPAACPECRDSSHWLPIGAPQAWRCSRCHPPPSRAFVASTWDASADVDADADETLEVFEVVVLAGGPVCSACNGAWYVENWDSESGVRLRCWTCREPVDGEVVESMRPAVKNRGLCARGR